MLERGRCATGSQLREAVADCADAQRGRDDAANSRAQLARAHRELAKLVRVPM